MNILEKIKKTFVKSGKVNVIHALGWFLLIIGIIANKITIFSIVVLFLITTSLSFNVDVDKITSKFKRKKESNDQEKTED